MKDKSKQVWYLYANDVKELKRECYEIIATLYVQLGQAPEAEIVVQMTNLFCNDLATNYGSMELEEVKYALNKHIRENDGPHFVNVPTWNEALRSYKMSKALKRQTNQIITASAGTSVPNRASRRTVSITGSSLARESCQQFRAAAADLSPT